MAPLTPRYPVLAQIKDPILQKAFKALFDKVAALESQATGIGSVSQPLGAPLDANLQRLMAVADPLALTDAVNLQTLQGHVSAMISLALAEAGTTTPGVTPPATTPTTPPTPPSGPGGSPTPTPNGPWAAPQPGTGLVRIGGKYFTLGSNGPFWPWRGCSDFRLYQRYLDGENIAPVLANRVASGANLCRVLGMMYNITNFYPKNYPTYFTSLPTFADLLLASGLYLEFCVFADCQNAALGLNNTAAQVSHFQQVVTALAGKTNVFLELVNEYPFNGVNPNQFSKPSGILSSAGSAGGGADPFLPPWDYVSHESPRDSEWVRKFKDIQDIRDGPFGNTTTYSTGVLRPVLDDEPMGAGNVDVPGKRSTDVNDFYWFGAGAAMFGVGATFHSDDGIASIVFGATQQACANNFYTGMAAVPAAAQGWNYTRGPQPNCPLQHDDALALRTYAKDNGTSAIAVVIRPQPGWVPLTQAGWSIVSSTGPAPTGAGTLITLSKP